MANNTDTLALHTKGTFETKIPNPMPNIPNDTGIDKGLYSDLSNDIHNLAKNSIANTELKIASTVFIDKLKKFLELDVDATNTKSEIDEKLDEISSTIETGSIEEQAVTGIKSINLDENEVSSDASFVKIDLENDIVEKIANNILSVINFGSIVKTTIVKTCAMIKSLIDADAKEFKKTLNDEFNKGLKLYQFNKLSSEDGENILEKTNNNDNQNKDDSDDSELETPSLDDQIKPEGLEESKDSVPAEDKQSEDKLVSETDADKQNNIKNKKEMSESEKATAAQKKLELQRKRDLLKVDKDLDNINQSLKKIIEKEDIVEEYKPRESKDESSEKDDKDEKKKKKDKSEKSDDIELEDLFEDSNAAEAKAPKNRKFGKALLLGSTVIAMIALRGWGTHLMVQNYVQDHADDEVNETRAALEKELEDGEQFLDNVESKSGSSQAEEEKSKLEKKADEYNDQLKEIQEALEKEDPNVANYFSSDDKDYDEVEGYAKTAAAGKKKDSQQNPSKNSSTSDQVTQQVIDALKAAQEQIDLQNLTEEERQAKLAEIIEANRQASQQPVSKEAEAAGNRYLADLYIEMNSGEETSPEDESTISAHIEDKSKEVGEAVLSAVQDSGIVQKTGEVVQELGEQVEQLAEQNGRLTQFVEDIKEAAEPLVNGDIPNEEDLAGITLYDDTQYVDALDEIEDKFKELSGKRLDVKKRKPVHIAQSEKSDSIEETEVQTAAIELPIIEEESTVQAMVEFPRIEQQINPSIIGIDISGLETLGPEFASAALSTDKFANIPDDNKALEELTESLYRQFVLEAEEKSKSKEGIVSIDAQQLAVINLKLKQLCAQLAKTAVEEGRRQNDNEVLNTLRNLNIGVA